MPRIDSTYKLLLYATLYCLVAVFSAQAQTSTGTINITLMDQTGAVLPGAQVTISGADTGSVVRSLITNEYGMAVAAYLQPATYNIVVSKSGFDKLVRNEVVLEVASELNLRLELKPGLVTQSVTVVGQTPLLQEKSSSLEQVISRTTILELPLNGRNYLQLANLSAGVVPATGSRDNTFSAYGNSGLQNAFLLDGARNENYARGLDEEQRDVLRPPLDALEEFSVQTGNFSAQYGAAAGGIVNVVTKNGTNKIHGSAYEFLRNNHLDARDFFAPPGPNPLLIRNQFGGSLGGPIVKDRAWIFGAYEQTGNKEDVTYSSTVPTQAMKSGDFGAIPIFNPFTTQTNPNGSGDIRTQFVDNTIPSTLIDPIGQAVVNRFPDPNQPGLANNFVRTAPSLDNTHNYLFRADQQLSDKSSMFERFGFSRDALDEESPLPAPAQTPGLRHINTYSIGYDFTHSFNPTLINEFRFGWSHLILTREATLPRDEIIPGSLAPQVDSSIPTFSLSGFATIGDQPADVSDVPGHHSSGVWDLSDNVSKSMGKHLLKFGFESMYLRLTTVSAQSGRGDFGFTGVFTQNPQSRAGTGNAIADLLLGVANTATTGTIAQGIERGHYYGGYIQDDWTVSSRLTLNLGLRYELTLPYIEVHNSMANFILNSGDPLFGHLIQSGDSRKPRALITADKDNFAPRVGFAYRVPGARDLVIRGAYGIFYAQDQGNGIVNRMIHNPPGWGYGSSSIVSDQLFPSSGFILSSSTIPPLPPPINPMDFVLVPSSTAALTSWDENYIAPYVQEWNLSIEKQLPWNLFWEASYVGNLGLHALMLIDGNQPAPGPGSPNDRRPLAQYTDAFIRYEGPWNRSNYQGLSTRLEKRFNGSLSFLTSFTYGRSIDLQNPALDLCDTCGQQDNVQNSYNLKAQRGPSDNNIPLRFVLSGIWDAPFGRGRRFANTGLWSALVGSWEAGGIFQAQSGLPFTPVLSFNNTNTGDVSWPNRVCSGSLSHPTVQEFVDISCFQVPPSFTFGNSGRNVLTGPGSAGLDFSLHRVFRLPWENSSMEFRVEAFNALNHPQLGMPGNVVGTPSFGVIGGTAHPNRELQFGLRLAF